MGRGHEDDDDTTAGRASQRVDQWLWFARIVKSRTLAAGLVAEGRVRLNREKIAKASQTVQPGDVLTLTVGPRVRILKIQGIGHRRGPASEAQALYEDISPPAPPREHRPAIETGEREAGSGRPTKRDRRLIDKLKGD